MTDVTAILLGAIGPTGPRATPVEVVQATPASTWTIHHMLAHRPVSVAFYDTEGHEFGGGWTVVDENTIIATFEAGPVAGVALII
jgi:hypothetical protein